MSSLAKTSQVLLDRTVPYVKSRWGAFGGLVCTYFLRVYLIDGFFVVTYALGIYLLNLFIGFLSPAVDPEEEEQDGLPKDMGLPVSESDEFRPFTRKLPEFMFWCWASRAVLVSFTLTFFSVFDLPVFWPILLIYWFFLFVVTMKQQILHMIKHKYVPWNIGKKQYGKLANINKPRI
jgi:Rer1 family